MNSPNPNIVTRTPATPRKANSVGRIVANRTMVHSLDFEDKLRMATRRLRYGPYPDRNMSLRRNIQVMATITITTPTGSDSGLGSSLLADDMSSPATTPGEDGAQRERSLSPLNGELKTLVQRRLVDDYEILPWNSDDQDSNDKESTN